MWSAAERPAAAAGVARAGGALEVSLRGIDKRFGALQALEGVSLHVPAGSFHALLGENGAGKSTLVKCLVGYHRPDAGKIAVDGQEQSIRSPQDADALGIGMVYQHFTLVPSMTVAENLVMSRQDVPAVVRWRAERERLADFMCGVPFQVPLDAPVSRLGEVMRFADAVTVLRRGRPTGEGSVAALTPAELAEMMVGGERYGARREQIKAHRAYSLPEEPLRSACVPGMSVDENLALPASTALLVIDMQRDFVEPGGFGASLGNDVSRLGAIVPAVREPERRSTPAVGKGEGLGAEETSIQRDAEVTGRWTQADGRRTRCSAAREVPRCLRKVSSERSDACYSAKGRCSRRARKREGGAGRGGGRAVR